MKLKVFVADGAVLARSATDVFLARFSPDGRSFESSDADDNPAKSYLRRGVEAIGAFSLSEAEAFLRSQPIEASFERFVAFCRSRQIELFVVSNGLDFCLESLFVFNGIRDVRALANHAELEGDGARVRLTVSFPYDDAECTRCACCARNIMLTACGDDDRMVFVGVDDTDVCPAEYADIVFARGKLQSACQGRNISYYPFSSFDDVAERLAKLSTRRNLRPRREAAMKRRDAFIAEW